MKNYSKIFSVLSNETRLNILQWLKNPEEAFKETNVMINSDESISQMLSTKGGICVTNIAKRSGLSQPTISKYLRDLESINLLVSERHEKWTYYRRNDEQIDKFIKNIKSDL